MSTKKPGPIAPIIDGQSVESAEPIPPTADEIIAGKVKLSVLMAASSLEVATSAIAIVGESIGDVLLTAKGHSDDWTDKAFDGIIGKWNKAFVHENPFTTTSPDAVRYWQVSACIKAATPLGIPDLERIATKRWMLLFGPAFEFDKTAISASVRMGWADWLKAALPLNVTGPDSMSSATLADSIAMQVKALHDSDPATYPAPKVKASKKKNAKADPAKPANVPIVDDESDDDDEPAEPIAARKVPAPGKPATVPADENRFSDSEVSPRPVDAIDAIAAEDKSPSVFGNLVSIIRGGDAKTRKNMAWAFGKAIAQSEDDDAIMALYDAVKVQVKRIREAKAVKPLAKVS
jgi:hypothetical protein